MGRRLLILALALVISIAVLPWPWLLAGQAQERLVIANVRAGAARVEQYGKFEVTFEVNGSIASHPAYPFDPAPPAGVPARVGISVDGLFSPDDWKTVITQPGFLYQDYERRCIGGAEANDCANGSEWLYPRGAPVWKVRFAPQQAGVWRYRLRARDASGVAFSDVGTFTVTPPVSPHNHGFIRIARRDPGYFEYADGSPFIAAGHGAGFDSERFTYHVDAEMQRFERYRINFLRVWMSGSGIFMAPWNPWHSHHLPGEGGYLNPSSLSYAKAYADHQFALRLWDYADPAVENRRNPCMFQGFSNNIAVRPDTAYLIRARVRAVGVSGPRDARYPYGFTIRRGGWLGETCADPASTAAGTTRLVEFVNGTTGWTELTGTFTTGPNDFFLDNFYLILENTTGGDVFVDEVSVQEWNGRTTVGGEVLWKNRFAYHRYFDQAPSWQWDYVLEQAAQAGVTIRPVVLEKNDWIANHIALDGSLVGGYYDLDNDRFYAAPNTAVRRYHEYFWRYLIARWGYSRAVHSWELLNEGDPYNSNHYAQADAFGRFVRANDPSRHLVTTSTWHSFPIAEFWGNPTYSGVDYADVHAYACCGALTAGWAQQIGPPLVFESRPDYVFGGTGSSVRIPGVEQFNTAGGTPRALVIRGAGEWVIRYRMRAENFTGACGYDQPNDLAGPRLLWILDHGQPDSRSNVVPAAANGQEFLCSAPAGTYSWRTFDSRYLADGAPAPRLARLIINDDRIHTLAIYFQNGFGTGGAAWIDEAELIAPDGQPIYLNGSFDLTPLNHDTALLTAAYSWQIGGRSRSGPRKPVTRGEVALGDANDYRGDATHDQRRDTRGIWLHNFIWGQINAGGLYELYWDAENMRRYNLYGHFKAYRDFMDGIPLNNGRYAEARAVTSHPDLRAWGQVDRVANRGHLWVSNRHHTWRNVVDAVPIAPISGTITIPDLAPGVYHVTWWDTYTGTVTLTERVATGPSGLTLRLPAPLASDVALRFERRSTAHMP
ncbi:MAG: hypothetical protein RMK84_01705 [Oscillochloridaceae bacterium]|nr:DUF5060 domain-containing protein [Chloroflexaceae bacterium]MDW8388816.1 hypothetical protein [Oscillochloridaceae bacterium]